MKTKAMIAINGINLDSLGDILVQSIDEGDTSINIATVSRFGTYGQHITTREKRSTDVSVKFLILESELDKRSELLNKVRAWSSDGGALTLSYRQGQKLDVVCSSLPSARDFRKRDSAFTARFTAYNVPEWQDTTPTVNTLTGTNNSTVRLTMRGTARTKLAFTVENTSQSECDTVRISANGYQLVFDNLGLATGKSLVVEYVNDVMRATIDGVSVLQYRTPASSDDVWLNYGTNEISVQSDASCNWTVSAVGRWV